MAKDILHEIIRIAIGIGIGAVDVSLIDEPCSAWHESNVLEDFNALFFHRDVEGLDDIRLETPYSDGC